MQHTTLENGRWAELTFPQQMANIGSETSRVQKALEAGKDHRAEGAFARAQELIDLTIFNLWNIPYNFTNKISGCSYSFK